MELSGISFPPNIFHLRLVESSDVEPAEMEGQLYIRHPVLS